MRRIAIVVSTVLVSPAISAQFVRRYVRELQPGGADTYRSRSEHQGELGLASRRRVARRGHLDFRRSPGVNGSYTNGATSSLLGMSPNCPAGANTNRQTTHGIQSGCDE
jgi:hypothetical protein